MYVSQTRLFLSPDFEQNQRRAYHEVLITGDLSKEDISKIEQAGRLYTTRTYPDTTEFVYGNNAVNTVYFTQLSVSQFVPGGSGTAVIPDPPPMGVKGPLNNAFALTGRDTTRNDTGAILRYASPVC